MEHIQDGSYVEVIKTGRVGEVISRKRSNVIVSFCDKSLIHPEDLTFKESELKVVELPKIKTSEFGAFVRGDISLAEISNGTNLIDDRAKKDSEEYRISTEDLYAGVKHYTGKTVEEVFRWIDTIMLLVENMHFPEDMRRWVVDEVTEKNILAYVFDAMDELHWELSESEPDDICEDELNFFKDILGTWVESGGKEYSDFIKHEITTQYNDDNIDKQSEATQKLFKECLDYWCDVKKDPGSIQRRGYCYYCGTKIYPNDWLKARDAFEEYYQMTGDASAANTLGYIYYYGRCTSGVPEYDKAFMYFSVGHAYSYFESTYKLADMLAHGYGVVKDEYSANHLYWKVYKQNLKRFMKGDDCKFADAALRMGNVYRDGIGVESNAEAAYFYYLQADYAIRKRLDLNFYGDTVVFNNIQKALEETRKEIVDKGRTVKFYSPGWTKWTLIKHRRCRLTIKELSNGVLALDATPLKRRDEEAVPQMLITVPRADYCELRKSIRIKTAPEARYEIFNGESEIVFDSVEYDWSEKKTSFYLYDEMVGEIWTEYYSFTAPGRKNVARRGIGRL
ncbi:tetratricopeptide repeat protein [Oribacterium sp. FC2011]|uniref:tetratricopeptide repeat protein n=1 Tax=Oribacterium sp. FC2011 TaxID=1408311 RepID=UPI0004E0BEE2|nr:tetratricopeptide repeat protein [Oribacterium sp. FC2011]